MSTSCDIENITMDEYQSEDISLGSEAFSDDDNGVKDDDMIGSSGDLNMDSNHTKNLADKKTRYAQKERQTLARTEDKAVRSLRILVVLILFITAVLVSVAVYFYTSNDEEDDFEVEFAAQAARIMEQFHDSVEKTLQAMDAMSVATTSYAMSSELGFPRVTVPDFVFRGVSARVLSEAFFIMWSPLVTDETRGDWEAYTVQTGLQNHQKAFVTESLMRSQQDAEYDIDFQIPDIDTSQVSGTAADFRPQIWKTEEEGFGGFEYKEPGSGPYLPIWQVTPTPPLPAIMNNNIFDAPALAAPTNATFQSGKACIGPFTVPNFQTEEAQEVARNQFDAFVFLSQYRGDQESFEGDPISPMIYPVFDSLMSTSVQEPSIAGVFSILFYWRLYFNNILPEGMDGVIVVLENTQGQVFTYQLDGPDATYLGAFDDHDVKYNDMEVSANMGEYIRERASPETRSYTAVDLNEDFNNYKLRIYPSQSFEDDYVTTNPMIYTGIVVGIFFFTSLVFFLYDCLVERRQKIVMDKAVKSAVVVSSLFPENVRDRLLNEAEDGKQDTTRGKKPEPLSDTDKPVSNRKNWLASTVAEQEMVRRMSGDLSPLDIGDTSESSTTGRKRGKAIADKFAESTVMFADIAGFTEWSSARQPDEVFELLETLYGTFDEIALKRKVFKVETIGDCYMCVTGVPTPQNDHAVRMAKFARECIVKMKDLVCDLSFTLGDDTANLSIRVGLHSGEVTAGVLRGERARFQLFGDTVNTASRMESNGIRGRIHCSQATADKLIEADKGRWLTRRNTRIEAKGKGRMQTYWIHPKASRSSNGSSTDIEDPDVEDSNTEEYLDPSATYDETEVSNSNLMRTGSIRKLQTQQPQQPVIPLADTFKNASILFGDITGFSKWSSTRKPQDMINLLETIFEAFDTLARDLGVVKVETIGNCFLAVVGIPEPKEDHAYVLMQFGIKCMEKLKQLMPTLVPYFGEGTELLSFRCGIHSGDIVAGSMKTGVDTQRLQVFGPDVDIAARLQNSAGKGEIHCSSATVGVLKELGKLGDFDLVPGRPLSVRKSEVSTETYVLGS